MKAYIGYHRHFRNLGLDPKEWRIVDCKEKVFGIRCDYYLLGHLYYQIEDIDYILEYLELHGAKKISKDEEFSQ